MVETTRVIVGLAGALAQVRSRIAQRQGAGINEQNTKAVLIDPVLRALGWDLEDLDEVQREFKPQKADKPVDYALFVAGAPTLFVEAKSLDENLSDPKWTSQIMGYAVVAGVEWVVLTDGNEYRLYNAHAPVPVAEKLFRIIQIAADARVEEALSLLSKSEMQEKRLGAIWEAHFVDRRIQQTLEKLFIPEPDPSLVKLVRKHLLDLSPSQVKAGLRRWRFRFDAPTEPAVSGGASPPPAAAELPAGRATPHSDTSLAELIHAGKVHAPLALERIYKGRSLMARIEADGRISFGGRLYDSPSRAAGAARETVIGNPTRWKYPPTNGWTFWQFIDDDGQRKPIDILRRRANGPRSGDRGGI